MACPQLEMVPELHVMIAGLPRNGKSTSLNNIFDLNLPAGLSAKPVTEEVVSTKIERNGITLMITDTPGLRAANANIKDKATLGDMKKINKISTLFFLTLPVSPSSAINADYCQMLKNLTTVVGQEIWEWCLILLTYSDDVCVDELSSDEDKQGYQKFLIEHCMALQKALVEINVTKKIKPFFEYTSSEQFENQSLDGIVAIPVGKVPNISTEKLFPFHPWTHGYKWTDLAFMEILKINREVQHREELEKNRKIHEINRLRSALIQFKYNCCTVKSIFVTGKDWAVKGAMVGTVVGEFTVPVIGGIVGYAMGGNISLGSQLGRLLGKPVGAFIGLSIVGGTAATMVAIKYLLEQKEIKRREQEIHKLKLDQYK